MKNKLLLALSLILMLSACDKKKDRLTADTLVIAIDPVSVSVSTGTAKTLTAICRSAKSSNLNIAPAWTVDSNLGTFNPASGKTTVFTAGSTAGTGKIYATYSGVIGSVNVSVTSSTAVTPGPGPGPSGTLQYVLLSDSQASSLLDVDAFGSVIFHYFDGGDGSVDAAPWQISSIDAAPGCPVDATACTKVDYTNGVGYWGGFYLQFTAASNMSAYTKLSFYIKGSAGGEKLKIGMVDSNDPGGSALSKVNLSSYISISTSWQKVDIPFSDFTILDKSIVTQPFIIAFEDAYTGANATVYLDYIGFE